MCVCVCVCVCVCGHGCVCMHVCKYLWMCIYICMSVCVHARSWIPLYIIIYVNNAFHFLKELFCYLSFPSPETILLSMNTHMKTNRARERERERNYLHEQNIIFWKKLKNYKVIMNEIPRPSLILISERIFAWFRWNCNKKQTFKEFMSSTNMVCWTPPPPPAQLVWHNTLQLLQCMDIWFLKKDGWGCIHEWVCAD